MRNGKIVVGIDFDGTLANTVDVMLDGRFNEKSRIEKLVENLLFFIVDNFGIWKSLARKKISEEIKLNEDLKNLIISESNDVAFVIVTSNKNIEGIKNLLRKNGIEAEVLYSKRGGKNGFKFIDIILDDSYSELKEKYLWKDTHNLIFAELYKRLGGKVVSSAEEFKEIIKSQKRKLIK
jgi:hypothetical protein